MKFAVILIFTFYALTSFGQSRLEKKQQLFDDAEYFFWSEDYKEALYYYLELIKLDPDNANYNYKIGESYLNIPGQEPLGIPYFEKATQNLTEKKEYKRKLFTEDRAPLHALFYLGNAYRINNELDKALEVYDRFTTSPWYEGEYNLTVVENEIETTERAKIIKDSPTKITRHNAGKPINSDLSEFNAVVSGNGKTMVFMKSLKFYDGIFYSVMNDGNWTEPVNLNPILKSDGDLYPTGLSFEGDKLLLVKRVKNNDDIFISELTNGKWTKAIPISDEINTRRNESHASFSEDGKTIFLSSDRRGGEGGYDIWSSAFNNGEWNKPVNLGETINTTFDEATPFSVNNGKTLYFSSKGHYNMGGYDVFCSNQKKKSWTTPVNLGFPINTTGDNLFFVPVNNGKSGYITLNEETGFGNNDIYKIEILSKPTHVVTKGK